MKSAIKAVMVVALMIGVPVLASQPAWAVACPDTTGAWTTCTETDKNYTLISSDLPTTTGLTIGSIGAFHTVTFNFNTGGNQSLAAGTYTVEYTVQITDPNFTFLSASIDTTVPGATPGVTVTKDIYDVSSNLLTSLTSTSGSPDGPNGLGSGLSFIDVIETFTVDSGGILTAATNTYTQTTKTPSPASLILLGLGLTGIAAVSRKKK
jgi:hypothetical protein